MVDKKLKNQHRGGIANQAGAEFERHFGLYRVLLALERLRSGQRTRLALQLKACDVDDWVEDQKGARDYFSLKRMKRLTWGVVLTDFTRQLREKRWSRLPKTQTFWSRGC